MHKELRFSQTKPDSTSQTYGGELKAIDWNEHLPKGTMKEMIWKQLIDLLDFHSPAFSKDMTELGCMPVFQHRIKLKPDAKVVHQRPYHTIPENEAEIQEQVQTLLDLGIITYSVSIWSSGVILVEKKTEKPGEKPSLWIVWI